MNRTFLLRAVLVIQVSLICFTASGQKIEWEKSYGGNHSDYMFDVIATSDYGFLVAGSLSYPGPSNPKTYSRKDDYSYIPKNLEEFPAIAHDLAYDRLKIKGSDGLFTTRRAIKADYTFVVQELAIALNPANGSFTRLRAGILGVGLGLAALPKTIKAAYWEVHDTTK